LPLTFPPPDGTEFFKGNAVPQTGILADLTLPRFFLFDGHVAPYPKQNLGFASPTTREFRPKEAFFHRFL